jgi:hypothetical protein
MGVLTDYAMKRYLKKFTEIRKVCVADESNLVVCPSAFPDTRILKPTVVLPEALPAETPV